MNERAKDGNWTIVRNANGKYDYGAVQIAVLQDIRDELKSLNSILRCPNFLQIPKVLKEIRRNTTRKKKKPTAKPSSH